MISLIAVPVLSCTADVDNVHQNGADMAEERGVPANGGTDEPNDDTVDELRFPDLPNVNFGEYEFRILNTGEDFFPWILKTLVVEEETGEALNDSIFRRNRRIEERFGFTLVQIDATGPSPVRDRARLSIQAGSDDFDLVMTGPGYAIPLVQEGMFEMLDRIPYIDLSQPWWDHDMIRDYSIGGRVLFVASDFTFNHYSVTQVLLFNKELHADLGLDCPYQLVNEGRWTIERLGEMGRAAVRDLNADGVINHHDQLGLVSFSHIKAITMMNGIGARYVIKDADDMPQLNMNTEGFISRFIALFDILTDGNWVYDSSRPDAPVHPNDLFLNNQALFWADILNWATTFRAMDSDFGILPMPKLNEQQEYYIAGVGIPHTMNIPITSTDLERTGIILEALSAESRITTRPVYFDTMLVNQVMNRDEESAEMLDIIFANRVYEKGRHFWNAHMVGPVANAFRDFDRDIVSRIEMHQAAATADIERTVAAFLE